MTQTFNPNYVTEWRLESPIGHVLYKFSEEIHTCSISEHIIELTKIKDVIYAILNQVEQHPEIWSNTRLFKAGNKDALDLHEDVKQELFQWFVTEPQLIQNIWSLPFTVETIDIIMVEKWQQKDVMIDYSQSLLEVPRRVDAHYEYSYYIETQETGRITDMLEIP